MQPTNWHGRQNATDKLARSPKCPQPHFLQTELLGRVILLNNFGSFIEGEKDRLRCVRALSRVLVHLNVRCGRCHRQSSFDPLYTTTARFLGYHQHRQYFSCQFFLLVPFQTGLSAPKNAKIADSNHKLSFHSRRIPVDTGQPFTATWKVVMVEKMLFEDSLVCHDPPSARISPSNDSLPPPCRSTAGMRALSSSALLPGRSSKPCTHKQDARDTVKWLTMPDVIDHNPGARAALAQAKKFLISQFRFSAPRCCGFVTSRSQLRFVAVVGENDSLSFFFQAVTYRCAPALEPFFTGSRSEEEGAEAHGPEDRPSRRRVVLLLSSSLELPAIRLEGILLLTPSLVGLLLQYTRNPQQTGRKRKRSSTHRRSYASATNKVVEILILGTVSSPRPLIWLPSCFAKQQSGHSSVIVWFCFSRKSPQKWRKLPPHRNKRPKTKK